MIDLTLKNAKILIVDDQQANLDVLTSADCLKQEDLQIIQQLKIRE